GLQGPPPWPVPSEPPKPGGLPALPSIPADPAVPAPPFPPLTSMAPHTFAAPSDMPGFVDPQPGIPIPPAGASCMGAFGASPGIPGAPTPARRIPWNTSAPAPAAKTAMLEAPGSVASAASTSTYPTCETSAPLVIAIAGRFASPTTLGLGFA